MTEKATTNGDELADRTPPALDDKCSRFFSYRDLIECGETQRDTRISNLPLEMESYLAIRELATQVLDPVQDRFGRIRLTYGFSSRELIKKIPGRIAPARDQHASYERKLNGNLICDRGGAACDFIIDGADMREVAEWMLKNTPADRIYFYGYSRPVHASHSSNPVHQFIEMLPGKNGRRVPRVVRNLGTPK